MLKFKQTPKICESWLSLVGATDKGKIVNLKLATQRKKKKYKTEKTDCLLCVLRRSILPQLPLPLSCGQTMGDTQGVPFRTLAWYYGIQTNRET